jgi:hypothetical protein
MSAAADCRSPGGRLGARSQRVLAWLGIVRPPGRHRCAAQAGVNGAVVGLGAGKPRSSDVRGHPEMHAHACRIQGVALVHAYARISMIIRCSAIPPEAYGQVPEPSPRRPADYYSLRRARVTQLATRILSDSVSRDSCAVDVRPVEIRGADLRTPLLEGGSGRPRLRRVPSGGRLCQLATPHSNDCAGHGHQR